jgi:predicted nucleotidyltransferase
MVTAKQIKEFCKQIASEFHPDKIILFGSHASGKAGPYSDVDLLIVMPFEGSPLQQAAKIITRLNPQMSVDLIVQSPSQVNERLARQDGFMRGIIENGKVAYEVQHA